MKKFKTQVAKEHYDSRYESLERFISYHQQAKLIANLQVKTILEIGGVRDF